MKETLRLLIDLQHVDRELSQLKGTRNGLEGEKNALAQELERVQEVANEVFAQYAELEERRKELSADLQRERDNMAKAEGRLPAIKTQKEYVAVLKEIDTAKKLGKELEESLEANAKELQTLKADKEEREAELSALQEKHDTRCAEIEAALDAQSSDLGSTSAERAELFGKLDRQLQRKYELLFERRDGVAVAEAVDGACTGCNMHLPPQLFNRLYTTQEIMSCPHCNRLIYLREA